MGETPGGPAVGSSDAAPPNPLDRFTSGGWLKGALRLAFGIGLVALVLRYMARDAFALLLARDVTLTLFAGAAVHLVQRMARILKWARMIEPTGLIPRPRGHLLRVQLLGMLANLLLPVSEAIKLWAVSRNKSDAVAAGESIVVDTALHVSMVGAVGLAAALSVKAVPTVWAAAAALLAIPLLLIAALRRRRDARPMRIADPQVLAWCALETLCQLATYALAMRAVGVALPLAQLLALGPILFIADLVMLTPSGLGLREALFAIALGSLSSTPADASVAMALLITTMLLVATAAGGGIALLLPRKS